MRTLILCGGFGTRAHPWTVDMPKPLLPVGGRPVLEHVMQIYADQGFSDFVLAAGYKRDLVAAFARTVPAGWRVEVVDTGEETGTGERIARCRAVLGDSFFVTYSDGLGDVDLDQLRLAHRAHTGCATITTVPMPSQYGTVELDGGGRVRAFCEKPRLEDHLVNAGFMVFDRRAFDHWAGPDLERDVLPALAGAGELHTYRHDGFWRSMDTYKDALELSELCVDGKGPWSRSTTHVSS